MSVAEHIFDSCADCVKFCPIATFEDRLVVGCYEFLPKTEQRIGGVHFLRLESLLHQTDRFALRFSTETSIPGVLDVNWRPVFFQTDACALAVAAADGNAYLIKVGRLEVDVVSTVSIATALLLSVDWTRLHNDRVFFSTSDGNLASVCVGDAELRIDQRWRAHELETWCVAADRHSEWVVYSGADDGCFKGWDIRTDTSNPVLTFNDKKEHSAGVCSIASDPHQAFNVATGSYDEKLRFWDIRNTSKAVAASQLECVGGVWRLSYHPLKSHLLAAACMHGGIEIFSKTEGRDWCSQMAYTGHGSLAYGIDWHHGQTSDVVASCSFYDKLLRVWKPMSSAS